MSAADHLSEQFDIMSLRDIGRLRSADFPGMTMNQVARRPLQARGTSGEGERYSRSDFRALVRSVRAEGVREPLLVGEGELLEGHHRFRAAKRAGLTHVRVMHEKDALDDAVAQYAANRRVP